MADYRIQIRHHYSGLLIGHCSEEPGISVLGRDHEEVILLVTEALAELRGSRSSDPALGGRWGELFQNDGLPSLVLQDVEGGCARRTRS